MCRYCLTSPCPAGCPNADEIEPKETCKYCGEGLLKEEAYVDINGECYHVDCLEEMSTRELLELLEVEVRYA